MFGFIMPALACGGFVCDAPDTPVVQNAERIAFHIDEQAGTVEAHVQVFYEGPPDRFAWIVPVAAEPEVFISSNALFDVASQQFAPVVRLDTRFEGRCGPVRLMGCNKSPTDDDTDMVAEDGDEPVEVVSEGQIGPYDYAVLTASTPDALLTWMGDNEYDVPGRTAELLAPYISADSHFLTVRLTKGRDAGDIAPLGWKYAATEASIPIQLTALAAAPDMGLEVYVFGEHRAVPTSYLHVQVNSANLDWFDAGSNYYDLVARAADQAGGHAFATDYYGPAGLDARFWNSEIESRTALLDPTSPSATVDAFNDLGLLEDSNILSVLDSHSVARDTDPSDPLARIRDGALDGVDLVAFIADLEIFVFEPLRRVQALVDQPSVTRLSSSLDADEMTVDPVFVLNADMTEPVSNQFQATLVYECNGRDDRAAPRRLELEDGRVYRIPPEIEMSTDDSDFWRDLRSDVDAVVIEETAKEGQPQVLLDQTETAWADVDGSGTACGCKGASMPYTAGLLVLLGAVLARRQR